MSMRKDLGRSRALRPSAESLEGRQLLSATVSGTDTAGDKWTLTLLGKGTLQVVKQTDPATGSPGTLDSATEINSITVSGTDPRSTRLIGTVVPAAGSDGRVFFKTLTEIPNHSRDRWRRPGHARDQHARLLPRLHRLGQGHDRLRPWPRSASPTASTRSASAASTPPSSSGPTPPSRRPRTTRTTSSWSSWASPTPIGTSIVVNNVISNTQAGVTASGSTTPGAATQKSVVFEVGGRINLFQANEIDGNTTNAAAADGFTGGTIVASFADPIDGHHRRDRLRPDRRQRHQLLGRHRTTPLSNLYIGGETNNVAVLTPNGSRNLYFGKGLDTTTILTHSIENLYANRGCPELDDHQRAA